MRCPRCSFENSTGMRFCGSCGAPLNAPAGPSQPERRQLTVMFCDLTGSTELSTRLDPEDLREVLRAYQAACGEEIRRFEGYVAQYRGDGVLVYFGYPLGHEDAALRAVRAALAIVAAIDRLNERMPASRGVKLAVHIGVHTGLVVVGGMDAGGRLDDNSVFGETPNFAARVMEQATSGMVLISAATERLVRGFVACRALGSRTLKGIPQPAELYEVLGEGARRSRVEGEGGIGLTPLTGRVEESRLLLERWEQARQGRGQVVLLRGEAGIGKSRLVQEVAERSRQDSAGRWQCHCSAYHQSSVLYPIIEAIERRAGFERGDPPERRLEKLQRTAGPYLDADGIARIASLLSVPPPAGAASPTSSPRRQKQRLLETLVRLVLAAATAEPLLFIVEDLHWADPSTLEFLDRLVDRAPEARLLALFTFRPEVERRWSGRAHVVELALRGLSDRDVRLMLERVTEGKPLPAAVVEQVAAKADGVPLYVEEVARSVLESGRLREVEGRYELTGALHELSIPATVHDSLIARLDRLRTVKPVAQLGATLGRSFLFALIHAVSPLDESALRGELERLVDVGILNRRGPSEQPTYIFTHALIRDAAYQSLLKTTRQRYHREIAQALEKDFPETVNTQPELLAQHYTEAGLARQAVGYWLRAGKRTAERSANAEAIVQLNRGLELLRELPDHTERIQQELAFRIAMTGPLIATRGYTSPEMEQTVDRALELCREIGETPLLFPTLYGRWAVYYAAGQAERGHELAEEFLRLAEARDSESLRVVAHRLVAHTLFIVGQPAAAPPHVERVVALYDAERDHALALLYGTDPKVTAQGVMAASLVILGRVDEGLSWGDAAIELVRSTRHANSIGYAWIWCGALPRALCRDGARAQRCAETALEFANEHDLPLWVAWGTAFLGWALVQQGRAEEGVERLHTALAGLQAHRFGLLRPAHLSWLAEGYAALGRPREGLPLLDEALGRSESGGDRWFDSEMHRLRGELLAADPGSDAAEVEACFQRATHIAREQQARLLELRAATSLARFWTGQGRAGQAHDLLAPLVASFVEGGWTRDMCDARSLLDELGNATTSTRAEPIS